MQEVSSIVNQDTTEKNTHQQQLPAAAAAARNEVIGDVLVEATRFPLRDLQNLETATASSVTPQMSNNIRSINSELYIQYFTIPKSPRRKGKRISIWIYIEKMSRSISWTRNTHNKRHDSNINSFY
ncbi:unnamed protein product [Acanthoscelides obtectus]|uniref:Uncharacterized protein n=1 Tax=Acanthoscelides obtectus TaxID=200917 RepID=A0A9P0PRV6_ACAOB|nr:unnamed protein product [Acanthoscelides obtectus]CAK1669151.1 hypothetical protein AOBTE_LOCUS26833 [Acanthoscelides obtectus]